VIVTLKPVVSRTANNRHVHLDVRREPNRVVHLDVRQDISERTARPPAVKRKRHRRVRLYQPRAEFKLISLLKEDEATRLDKLRNDLEESVERTIRIEQAFVKELSKYTRWSNRAKTIVKAIGEVPFHSDVQRKIISTGVTSILESKALLAKKREEEAAKERAKDCTSCYLCDHN
jgi:hypothetical protein